MGARVKGNYPDVKAAVFLLKQNLRAISLRKKSLKNWILCLYLLCSFTACNNKVTARDWKVHVSFPVQLFYIFSQCILRVSQEYTGLCISGFADDLTIFVTFILRVLLVKKLFKN